LTLPLLGFDRLLAGDTISTRDRCADPLDPANRSFPNATARGLGKFTALMPRCGKLKTAAVAAFLGVSTDSGLLPNGMRRHVAGMSQFLARQRNLAPVRWSFWG
jgi:hypothetical protein